jgi:hypothetical protein
MAALCRFFDTDGDGFVDGPELLRGFFKMQQDFHECVADRINSDNKTRADYLESLFKKRVPTNQRSPTNPLRKSQMPEPVTPKSTTFLRQFSVRAASIDESRYSPRQKQESGASVQLQPLHEAEENEDVGDVAIQPSQRSSTSSDAPLPLERKSSSRESVQKGGMFDTSTLDPSLSQAPLSRRPSGKLSSLGGMGGLSGDVSPLRGSSPPSAKPAKTRRASVAEMMGKVFRPQTPIVNHFPSPAHQEPDASGGLTSQHSGGLTSHRSSNNDVASSEVKLKPLGGERQKLQDAVLAAVAPTRKDAIKLVRCWC